MGSSLYTSIRNFRYSNFEPIHLLGQRSLSLSISLGFIHLQTGKDYHSHEPHGHIADLIVATQGEGRGIGRALMERTGRARTAFAG